jgi:hypothetical protein
MIEIEQKKLFSLKNIFYTRNVKFCLKMIKDVLGRLGTVMDGWERLRTVGDGRGWVADRIGIFTVIKMKNNGKNIFKNRYYGKNLHTSRFFNTQKRFSGA